MSSRSAGRIGISSSEMWRGRCTGSGVWLCSSMKGMSEVCHHRATIIIIINQRNECEMNLVIRLLHLSLVFFVFGEWSRVTQASILMQEQ